MRTLQLADEVRYAGMSTEELRASFLVDHLFKPGSIELVYVDLDRTVIGSATPLSEPLELPCPEQLRASSFTERREIGILNIGSRGVVHIDDASYPLENRDALYVGRGGRAISFTSTDPGSPAEFYLLSYPPTPPIRWRECKPATSRRKSSGVQPRRTIGRFTGLSTPKGSQVASLHWVSRPFTRAASGIRCRLTLTCADPKSTFTSIFHPINVSSI